MASTSNGCPVKIVDPLLELLDPIPNIHELFIEYDALFFKKVLNNHGVEVRWSPRMTLYVLVKFSLACDLVSLLLLLGVLVFVFTKEGEGCVRSD